MPRSHEGTSRAGRRNHPFYHEDDAATSQVLMVSFIHRRFIISYCLTMFTTCLKPVRFDVSFTRKDSILHVKQDVY